MNILFGFILVAGSVLGGFWGMGGNLWILWQPFEMLIIVGAAIGAFIISNPNSVLKETSKGIFSLIRGKPYKKSDYLELFSLLYLVFKVGRSNLKKLESDLDNPNDSNFFKQFPALNSHPKNVRFLADYMRLILLGSDKAHELEALIDEEIDTIEKELHRVPNALTIMSDSLPALGIVAAVLGVIKAMGAISEPPEVLGGLIGGALVGTFLGVLLSYGLVGPLAGALRARREQELAYYVSIKASLMAFLNGYAPQICVEYGRKVVSEDVRPNFEEVETTTNATAQKTGMKI